LTGGAQQLHRGRDQRQEMHHGGGQRQVQVQDVELFPVDLRLRLVGISGQNFIMVQTFKRRIKFLQ
jgi:hypothetical protein